MARCSTGPAEGRGTGIGVHPLRALAALSGCEAVLARSERDVDSTSQVREPPQCMTALWFGAPMPSSSYGRGFNGRTRTSGYSGHGPSTPWPIANCRAKSGVRLRPQKRKNALWHTVMLLSLRCGTVPV